MTNIEWTERTWNPIAGCSIISPGCIHCYAMTMAHRLAGMGVPHYQGLTKVVNGHVVWTGKVHIAPDKILMAPLQRQKPTLYFVNSMSDLFHEDVPDEWILAILDVVRRTSYDGGSNCGAIDRGRGEHRYQVLTKRSRRMMQFMRRLRWDGERLHLGKDDSYARVILRNLWLGVSCEDQTRAEERLPDLRATPAAVRFISAEPLLADLGKVDLDGIHWVIAGGESGVGARAMHPDWARSIRDQCTTAGIPYFFKQWGSHEPIVAAADMQDHMRHEGDDDDLRDARRKSQVVWPDGRRATPEPLYEWWANQNFDDEDAVESEMTGCAVVMRNVGKKIAGRLLDGREWNEMPRASHGIGGADG